MMKSRSLKLVAVYFPQGARELAHPPTLTDIFHSKFDKAEETSQEGPGEGEEEEESKQGAKRKFDPNDVSEQFDPNQPNKQDRNMKRAKNVGI